MRLLSLLFAITVIFTGCKVYNQNIIFKTKTDVISDSLMAARVISDTLRAQVQQLERNYQIQVNDVIEVRIYDNKGEILVNPPDPEQQNANGGVGMGMGMGMGMGAGGQGQGGMMGGGLVAGNTYPLQFPSFLIQSDGTARLPLVDYVELEGLTLAQADSLLEIKYAKFYEQPLVRTRYLNKRVVVINGTVGVIYPLMNEKVNLVEVLAATGGFPNNIRATNIRLIRGDLQNPNVYVIDLSTVEGARRINLTVEPNDIIVVEPIRKSFLETLGDISPILSFVTTIFTFIVLLR